MSLFPFQQGKDLRQVLISSIKTVFPNGQVFSWFIQGLPLRRSGSCRSRNRLLIGRLRPKNKGFNNLTILQTKL